MSVIAITQIIESAVNVTLTALQGKVQRVVNTGAASITVTLGSGGSTITVGTGAFADCWYSGTTWYSFLESTDTVKTAGAQTIADVKTFSSIPVLPASDPTTDNQAVRKAYADSIQTAAASDATSKVSTHAGLTATHGASGAVVGTTNTQTLTNKTISTGCTIASSVKNHPMSQYNGELNGTVSEGTIYNTLYSYVPSVGDKMAIRGSLYYSSSSKWIPRYFSRYSSSSIGLYYMPIDSTGVEGITFASGGSANYVVNLSW